MTARHSAGLLLYRRRDGILEVLLAHMGGPFWAGRDAAAWSIPKGEYPDDEEPRAAAVREFAEELGSPAPPGDYLDLGDVRQSGGKLVTAFAVQADFDPASAVSNLVRLEWPRGSGRMSEFPEVDRVEWMPLDVARGRLVAAQSAFLDRLVQRVSGAEADVTSAETDVTSGES